MSGGDYSTSRPAFIDQLAVDLVVCEHRRLKLTPSERRHAAHRLHHGQQGLTFSEVAEVLGVTRRTVERLLQYPPPPILDVNEHGQIVNEDGEVVGKVRNKLLSTKPCKYCPEPERARGLCGMHYRRELRGADMLAPPRNIGANANRPRSDVSIVC
jgi:hypothetical protein